MKTMLLLTLVSVFAINTIYSQGQADPKAPVMKFEFTTHDFGDLSEGDNAKVDFWFTNTGKSDLVITNVKASCGCTTPYWSKEPVAPGKKSKISAKYNTVNRPGQFNKPITISSNASEPTKRIIIKGNVIKETSGIPEKKPSIVNQ